MKLLRILPLALCYLVFCGCSAEAHEQDHDTHEKHEHDDHEHDDGHEHDDHEHDDGHGHEDETGDKTPASKPTKKTGKLNVEHFDHFGEGATEGKTVTPSDLAANLDVYKGKRVRLKGTVSAVCKKKGCWMYVGEGENRVKVRFKDYGFFVPTDCEGRTAILEGEFSLYTMSVAERKHYLEDEGKLEEAAKVTEPKQVPLVMADGVALAKVSSKR